MGNIKENCDLMIDQVRSLDNNRLINKVGKIPPKQIEQVKKNLKVVLDL